MREPRKEFYRPGEKKRTSNSAFGKETPSDRKGAHHSPPGEVQKGNGENDNRGTGTNKALPGKKEEKQLPLGEKKHKGQVKIVKRGEKGGTIHSLSGQCSKNDCQRVGPPKCLLLEKGRSHQGVEIFRWGEKGGKGGEREKQPRRTG